MKLVKVVAPLLGAALLAWAAPAVACKLAPPLRQEEGENDAAFEVRRKLAEAEEHKTPEQRELEFQGLLWEQSEMVFVGQVVRVKIDGKVYPRPEMPQRKGAKKPRIPPPVPMIEPVPFLAYGKGHEAYIRSVRMLKGNDSFKPSWHNVGGVTNCGGTNDGSLGSVYPGEKVLVFASWGSRSNGNDIVTRYLDLHGLQMDEIVEPRLKAAMEGNATIVKVQ